MPLRRTVARTAVASALILSLPAAAYGATISYGFSMSGNQTSDKRVPSGSSSDKSLPSTNGNGATNVNYSCAINDNPAINYKFNRNITAAPDKTITSQRQVYGCQYNYAGSLSWPSGKYYFLTNVYFVGQSSVSGTFYART